MYPQWGALEIAFHPLFSTQSIINMQSEIETKQDLEHNDIERAHSHDIVKGGAIEERIELSEEDVSLPVTWKR
jgi:hypothetical protein